MNFPTAESMGTITTHQREDFGRKIFAYEAIASQIKDAATKGQAHIRVNQTISTDDGHQTLAATLKETKAARQLAAKLKKAGYTLEWVATVQPERIGRQETGAFVRYSELRISWGSVNIYNGPDVTPEN